MVISNKIAPILHGSSAIRKLFEEGKELAEKVGAENVYDYSLGNPSVPAPDVVRDTIVRLVTDEDPLFIHG